MTMTEATREQIVNNEVWYIREEAGEIHPQTGHQIRWTVNIVNDEVAMQCTTGPDRADPPSRRPEMLPKLPPIWMPQEERPCTFPGRGGGIPSGGGFTGGGGGPPGGAWGLPPIPAPQANPGKLVEDLPTVWWRSQENPIVYQPMGFVLGGQQWQPPHDESLSTSYVLSHLCQRNKR